MTIDPAAEFLLDMQPVNLFEPCGNAFYVRCKGCYGLLPTYEKESHYQAHRRAKDRSESLRKERVKAERLERLARAREAKRHGA